MNKLAACPYCRSIYNEASKRWVSRADMKLTENNHYYHMCDQCAKKRGVDYYEI